VPRSKRTKKRRAVEPTPATREITRDELARLIASLPPDIRITIEYHVHAENPARAVAETPLTIAQAAEALNVSERTITRLAGLEWLEFQGAGRRTIKRITAESVQRLRDASDH
jgi:hypothetical protein